MNNDKVTHSALGFPASVLCALLLCAPAHAQGAPEPVEAVAAALACRGLDDAAEKLACFERAATGLEAAFPDAALPDEERREVVEERRQRRIIDLFGFARGSDEAREVARADLPSQSVQVDEEAVREIELAVAQVSRTPNGKALIVLENGQVWRQTDSDSTRVPMRDSTKSAEIRRKLFGSYSMRLDNGLWFTARRIS